MSVLSKLVDFLMTADRYGWVPKVPAKQRVSRLEKIAKDYPDVLRLYRPSGWHEALDQPGDIAVIDPQSFTGGMADPISGSRFDDPQAHVERLKPMIRPRGQGYRDMPELSIYPTDKMIQAWIEHKQNPLPHRVPKSVYEEMIGEDAPEWRLHHHEGRHRTVAMAQEKIPHAAIKLRQRIPIKAPPLDEQFPFLNEYLTRIYRSTDEDYPIIKRYAVGGLNRCVHGRAR